MIKYSATFQRKKQLQKETQFSCHEPILSTVEAVMVMHISSLKVPVYFKLLHYIFSSAKSASKLPISELYPVIPQLCK